MIAIKSVPELCRGGNEAALREAAPNRIRSSARAGGEHAPRERGPAGGEIGTAGVGPVGGERAAVEPAGVEAGGERDRGGGAIVPFVLGAGMGIEGRFAGGDRPRP